MPNTQSNTAVALLYQTQELGRHMRDALSSLGTPIVYEAATDQLDPDALQNSGARVVIVNLDPAVEAHLDDVYGLVDDERYSVVFNDAQVSSNLSGWDQARWARHLAAKILGDANIDPPRPEGAEAVPARTSIPTSTERAPAAEAESKSEPDIETERTAAAHDIDIGEDDPADALIETALPPVDEPVVETGPPQRADPTDLLESRFDEINQPAAASFPASEAQLAEEFDFSALEALTSVPTPPATHDSMTLADEFRDDSGELTLTSDASDDDAPARDANDDEASDEDVFDLAALDRLFEDSPAASDATSIDVGDLGDFGTVVPPTAPAHAANEFDAGAGESHDFALADDQDFALVDDDAGDISAAASADVAGHAAQVPKSADFTLVDDDADGALAAREPPAEEIDFSSRGLDSSSANDIARDETQSASKAMPPLAAMADWSLEDMIEGDAPPLPPPVPGTPATFGIEKVSAAEYLAPPTDDVEPAEDSLGEFSFELMPMEEAVAPRPVEREAHEAWLDPDKVVIPPKIRRVWVLGASIGGPEAVREFLGQLPRDYPALFLLAQHMGAEFVDLMAQQLAKGTPLTVRTPTHGERVGHGEVVIVPTTHRMQIDPEGIVVLERSAGDAAYSPSIDRVLSDVADRYGSNAGAIIFSGMTNDAIEGAKYLAAKGGNVYVQHPDTCVVSSMVDGVVEAGIVKFLGSPKELAEQLLAEAATAGKR